MDKNEFMAVCSGAIECIGADEATKAFLDVFYARLMTVKDTHEERDILADMRAKTAYESMSAS